MLGAAFVAVAAAGAWTLASRNDGGASSRPGTALPTYTTPADVAYPAALLTGRLERRARCVYLTADEGPDLLLVWSPGTRLVRSADRAQVVSASGKVRGEVGKTVTFGGGETGRSAPMLASTEIDCPGELLAVVNP